MLHLFVMSSKSELMVMGHWQLLQLVVYVVSYLCRDMITQQLH